MSKCFGDRQTDIMASMIIWIHDFGAKHLGNYTKVVIFCELKQLSGQSFAGFYQNSPGIWKFFNGTVSLFRAVPCMKIFSPNFILSVSFILGLFLSRPGWTGSSWIFTFQESKPAIWEGCSHDCLNNYCLHSTLYYTTHLMSDVHHSWFRLTGKQSVECLALPKWLRSSSCVTNILWLLSTD